MSDTGGTALGAALGYEFLDPDLARRAVTHRSASGTHNERLEFLGDAVLGFAVADLLFTRFPDASEGKLTRGRAMLVRGDTLAGVARQLGLGAFLVLGPGEERSGGRERDSILAGAFEALLGAMYVESGYETVRETVERLFAEPLEQVLRTGGARRDPKTRLQELLQARRLSLPRYRIVSEEGAAHRPHFVVECEFDIEGASPARGEGASRREAEQRAAERALAEIGDDG